MSGLIDTSINFGLQNFIFVQKDTSDGTYDYYGFQNKKGTVLIMRTDKAFDNALYYSAVGTFSTIWSGKSGYTYVTPKDIVISSV
jgi:hypothetical protein